MAKRGKYLALSQFKKNKVILEAFKLWGEGKNYSEIADSLGIPKTTIYEWLSSEAHFELIKKTKSQRIALGFLDDIRDNRQEQGKKRSKASFSQLGTDIGIKWDKLHPPYLMAQQFNIGDKKIEVSMPKFFNPRAKNRPR